MILPVQRAEQAIGIGDQQRRPDWRWQAIEVKTLWHRHSLKNIGRRPHFSPAAC
jgi:hypothetical protein